MPDYEISYTHKGVERIAVIYADDFRDAYESLESLKVNAVVGAEIVAITSLQYEETGNDY